MNKLGFSIRIFLPDGTPEGLKIVEKSNWTGRAIVCPRARFADAKDRIDFGKTGVYVLIGPSSEPNLPTIYIGEGDPAKPRLESHFAKKDFWTSIILFISKDENLNKAHVQYLEARLLDLAKEAKRSVIDNGNFPQLPSLSEADSAEVEGFLHEMLLIYPALGVTAFERPRENLEALTVLYLRAKGLSAKGYETPQGFVVLKGSESPLETVPSVEQHVPYVLEIRKSLTQRGIFVKHDDRLILDQDYVFDSPSMGPCEKSCVRNAVWV
jgi:hypothetical protein